MYVNSMCLAMGSHMLRCNIALVPFLRQPGRVVVLPGNSPDCDKTYVATLIDYFFVHYVGSETARKGYNCLLT